MSLFPLTGLSVGFYLGKKEPGHAGERTGLGWARICLSVFGHVCLHQVSVCLSMSACGGVGPASCLCVSDHVCLIMCLHDASVCLSMGAFGGAERALCL